MNDINWTVILTSVIAVLAGFVAYFLHELFQEFKNFKADVRRDIHDLGRERVSFQSTVNQARLDFAVRVTDLQKLHQDFQLDVKESLLQTRTELKHTNLVIVNVAKKAEQLDQNFQKTLTVIKRHDDLLKSVKIELENITIFKGQKP